MAQWWSLRASLLFFTGSQNGPFGELFLVLPDTSLTHNTICESFFLQSFFGDVFGKAQTLSLELPLQREHGFHFWPHTPNGDILDII